MLKQWPQKAEKTGKQKQFPKQMSSQLISNSFLLFW